ncbi:hypothetical protein [Acidocella sp. KAb 2-4]|uniref:hypothetical protein n=1 Tax=Acidocella sp. KAb 2-4 TaxID=2885158 RepID=UPI001D076D4D|nr:hypothetical protein [Acidocella sp. KAb 2-4]MCB5943491.1 hypothetical protein [Acidocella sp. KAb 2-4]
MSMTRKAVSALSLVAGLAAAFPACAAGPFTPANSVALTVSADESQAQLAQQLNGKGYTNVSLTAHEPSRQNPHPELNTPNNQGSVFVRQGWNGTAQRDGQTVQIYVDPY